MVGWMILGGLAALITLLLLLPVRCAFRYRDEVALTIWIAFVPIHILPQRDHPEAEKSAKRTAAKPKARKKKSAAQTEKSNLVQELRRDRGISGLVAFFRQIAALVVHSGRKLSRRLILEKLDLRVAVSADDPAETATRYGAACAALCPAVQAFLYLVPHRTCRTEIVPDFLSQSSCVWCRLILRVRVFWLLRAVVSAAIAFLKLMIQTKKAVPATELKS